MLADQHRSLVVNGRSFDDGERWQARSLAVTAYLLVHDGGRNSKSLLGQLGLKGMPRYLSSSRGFKMEHADPDARGIEAYPPITLAIYRLDDAGVSYQPLCHAIGMQHWYRRLKFKKWYGEYIFKTARGRTLTRENLIHTVRSKDGGAHLDPLINDEAYELLARDPDPLFEVEGGVLPGAHFASMRQIAWELEQVVGELLAEARAAD